MPAQNINDALQCLRSAFPKTQFSIKDGSIVGGGITVAPGLLQGTALAMVRIVASQLKAIEDKALEKAQQDAQGA